MEVTHSDKHLVCVESLNNQNKTSIARSYRDEATLMGRYPGVEATLMGSATIRGNKNSQALDLDPKIGDHGDDLNQDEKREKTNHAQSLRCPTPNQTSASHGIAMFTRGILSPLLPKSEP